MERDINALLELYLHRTISSSQLARLCFPDISYETARKRLRRLQQAGFTGASSSGRMEGRGRPGKRSIFLLLQVHEPLSKLVVSPGKLFPQGRLTPIIKSISCVLLMCAMEDAGQPVSLAVWNLLLVVNFGKSF